eukprot:GHVH01009741.1.p1 GENE.GHVH01009741.1~~GHVH01009741.1.p1  ORF type:complete len:332 (-),score=41.92 GHVH01009741.1:68-1063(-)
MSCRDVTLSAILIFSEYLILEVMGCQSFFLFMTAVSVAVMTLQRFLRTLASPSNAFSWSHKTVLITGCSSGIGRSLTDHIVNPSLLVKKVIFVGRDIKTLERLQSDVLSVNHSIATEVIVLDLNDPRKCCQLIGELSEPIDVFVNNAGLSQRDEFHNMDYPSCEYMMNVNCNTPIALSNALIGGMIEKRGGLFVNTLSVSAMMPVPLRTMYCASKWALMGFYQSLRSELSSHDIRVVNVYPYYVKTNVSKNAMTGCGERFGKMDNNIANGYSTDYVARRIMDGIQNEENEIVIAPWWLRLSMILMRISPTLCNLVLRRQYDKQLETVRNAK